MSVNAEVSVQRRNTAAFIAANPSTLALIPTLRTRTATGGSARSDGPPRAAQTFRLVEQSHTFGNAPGQLRTDSGQQEKVDYLLIGRWDSLMAVGDHWTDVSGARFEILEMLPDNGYERRGQVRRSA